MGRCRLGVLDFRCRQAFRQQGERSAGNLLGIYRRIAVDAVVDTRQEQIPLVGRRTVAAMPALIIEAPQENRKTGPEVNGLVAFQAVAQGVEGGDQCRVSACPVMPAQSPGDVIHPFFGDLNGRSEVLNSSHDTGTCISWEFGSSCQSRLGFRLRKINAAGHPAKALAAQCPVLISTTSSPYEKIRIARLIRLNQRTPALRQNNDAASKEGSMIAVLVMASLVVPLWAAAHGHEIEVGSELVRNTVRQVEKYIAFNEGDSRTAARAVNDEGNNPTACAVVSIAFVRGHSATMVRASRATFQITDILVIGVITDDGIQHVAPAVQFSPSKIDEHEAQKMRWKRLSRRWAPDPSWPVAEAV
jgi:hypothetical protein